MKKVVIVGGGFCGLRVAKDLAGRFAVTLIDRKPYFEYTPSTLKMMAGDPKQYRKEFSKILKTTPFMQGEAHFLKNAIILKKKVIPYDYAVLSTGFVPFMPLVGKDVSDAASGESVLRMRDRLDRAKSVLIIGGGYIGVELAAELATRYPEKKVTLVHAFSRLLERNSERASSYALSFLKKKGVQVMLAAAISRIEGRNAVAEDGQSYTGDMILSCIGTRPRTQNIDDKLLNGRKEVKVRPTLQAEMSDNVFAGGDIAAIKEEKTAQNAERHGRIIAENILRRESGKPLKEYQPSPKLMVISLGRTCGILTRNNMVMTGFFPGLLKHLIEKKVMREYGC